MSSKKPSLAEVRAKYKAKVEGGGNERKFTGSNDVYPHWNIAENDTATVRILPDKNEDNEDSFFVDKLEHKLPIDGKKRTIACLKMWGEKCPICALSSKYYDKEGKKSENGKFYYCKRTSLMKALIIKDPIDYSKGGETAQGQVKTLQLTYQLMNLINSALADDAEETALESLPWELEGGYNFIIKKTKQGEYDNYSTGSGFSKKMSDIPEQYATIVTEGMVDLSTLLPKKPTLEEVQALLEQHLGTADSSDEAEDEEEDEDAVPVRKTSKVAESVDDEEIPVKKRKPVVEDVEEETVPPVKKRKPIVEDDEEEAPAPVKKKAAPVVVDEEEEVAPTPKKKAAPVVVEADDEEEDEDAALIARIRARKTKGE